MEETKGRLSVRTRKVGPITILDIAGRLQAGSSTDKFRASVSPSIDSDDARIILNLADLDYIDSVGLESLIELYKTMNRRRGHMKLLNPTKKVRELLELTRLLSIFEVETDEDAAVAALSVSRTASP